MCEGQSEARSLCTRLRRAAGRREPRALVVNVDGRVVARAIVGIVTRDALEPVAHRVVAKVGDEVDAPRVDVDYGAARLHARAARAEIIDLELGGDGLGQQLVVEERAQDDVVVIGGREHAGREQRVLADKPARGLQAELADQELVEQLLDRDARGLGRHRRGHLQVEAVVRPRRARTEGEGRVLVNLLRALLWRESHGSRDASHAGDVAGGGIRPVEARGEGEQLAQRHAAARVRRVGRPPRKDFVCECFKMQVTGGHGAGDGNCRRKLTGRGHHQHVIEFGLLLECKLPAARIARREGKALAARAVAAVAVGEILEVVEQIMHLEPAVLVGVGDGA